MSNRKPRHTFRLPLVLAGFILGCVLAEGMLRLMPPFWLKYRMTELRHGTIAYTFGAGSDQDWPAIQQNGRWIGFRPHSQFPATHTEFHHLIHIDEWGGRVTPSPASPQKTGVIPFLGDSFLFGVGVRDNETYLSRLTPYSHQRFINLGFPGSSLVDQLDLLEIRWKEWGQPRQVVFNVYLGNDLQENFEHDRPHLISSSEHESKPYNSWSIDALNLKFHEMAFFRKSYLAQLFKQGLLVFWNQRRIHHHESPYIDPALACLQRHSSQRNLWEEAWSRQIHRLVQLQQQNGFHSFFILIPGKYQVDPVALQNKCKYYGLNPTDLDRDQPNRIVSSCLKDAQIPYVDVTPQLRNHPQSDYYIYDYHLTAIGHQRVAEALQSTAKQW